MNYNAKHNSTKLAVPQPYHPQIRKLDFSIKIQGQQDSIEFCSFAKNPNECLQKYQNYKAAQPTYVSTHIQQRRTKSPLWKESHMQLIPIGTNANTRNTEHIHGTTRQGHEKKKQASTSFRLRGNHDTR
jgi:hypothetical protein